MLISMVISEYDTSHIHNVNIKYFDKSIIIRKVIRLYDYIPGQGKIRKGLLEKSADVPYLLLVHVVLCNKVQSTLVISN